MRKFFKSRIFMSWLYWGWIGILAWFYPVYWTQDKTMKNGGYDLLTLRSTGSAYFRGTWSQVDKFLDNTPESRA